MPRTFTLEIVEEDGRVSKAYGILADASSQPPPEAPANLQFDELTARAVSISWSPVDGATSYQIYRNGAPIGVTTGGGGSVPLAAAYRDETVVPTTSYSYQVQAIGPGGSSALSGSLPVTTPANAPPEWTLGDITAPINAGYALDLRTVCSDFDEHALTFSMPLGSIPGVVVTGNNLSGVPTTVGAYPITLDAFDGYDHAQVPITFTVIDPDVTAPTAPVLSGVAIGSAILWSWTASVDASGISEYRVRRGGTVIKTVDGNVLEWREEGLPNGNYTSTVRAVDASANLNVSVDSNPVTATINVPPPGPDVPFLNPIVVAGQNQLNLSFVAGPNGATPTAYELDRSLTGTGGWVPVEEYVSPALSVNDGGLSYATRFYYRVRAFANGIWSDYDTGNAQTASGPGAAADYTLSAGGTNNQTITVRKVSTGAVVLTATSSGTDFAVINRTAFSSAPAVGSIFEFEGGTYPSMELRNFNNGSAANPYIFRNKSGEVAIFRRRNRKSQSYVVNLAAMKYCVFDGSNGMGAWTPLNPNRASNSDPALRFSNVHGFRTMYATTATAGSPDSPTQWLKSDPDNPINFCTIKRWEFVGDSVNGGRSEGGAGYGNNDRINATTATSAGYGLWREGIILTECFGWGGMADFTYFGANYSVHYLPCKNVEVSYNRSEDTEQEGIGCKTWFSGNNSIHHNVVVRAGRYNGGTGEDTNQRCGIALYDGQADVYSNYVENSGVGRASASGYSGTPPHGIVISTPQGPGNGVRPHSNTNYAIIDHFTVRAYNNITVDCVEHGLTVRSTLTPIEASVYNNTSCRNGGTGLLGSGANLSGLMRNNIALQNGVNVNLGPLTGPVAANLTGTTMSTYLNSDFTLKAAQSVASGSALGTDVASTDFDGTSRTLAGADKGAHEYP